MQQPKKKDPLETWFRGFWFLMWGAWAAITLIDFIATVLNVPGAATFGFFYWACPLVLLNILTYGFLGIRRWRRGDD